MRTNRVRRVLGLLLVVVVAMVLTVGVGVAAAQTTGDTTYPTVSTTPTTDPCVTSSGASVCGTARVGGVSASRSLPFTGGDVALLTILGLAAVGSGAAIVVFSRRRSTQARA
jgi:hypothetical protein